MAKKKTGKTGIRASEQISVSWKEAEVTKEAMRLMEEAKLKGEVFTAQAELQRTKRTLEIIDLIIADKKLEAIKLLREPYDIKVSVNLWRCDNIPATANKS